jgi:hypothetical protein
MKNRIVGAIGILWGGSAIVRWYLGQIPDSGGADLQEGYHGAIVFGVLLFVGGIYYFFKKPE